MHSEFVEKVKELRRTPSGKMTLVSVVVAAVALLLLLVQGIFFEHFLSAGGWWLRAELLCLALAGAFGGYVAEWMEYHENARTERELVRSR